MDKNWLKQYDPRVKPEIDPDRYASIVDILDETVSSYGDNTAYINMGHEMSFSELDTHAKHFAAYLQHAGYEKGDAIAIMMPNLLQYPIAMFGILRAGMTVVNVNPLYTPRELKHQLNDSKAKAIVIVDNFAHTLEQVVDETGVREVLLTALGDMLPVPKRWLVNVAVKHVKKMVPKFSLPKAKPFMAILEAGLHLGYNPIEIDNNSLAFLQYTGGTTGVSKGAMLTHRNMIANLEQVSGLLATVIVPGKDLVVTALPLYHIFALTANCLLFLKFGCPNLLITNPRDMGGFVKILSKYPFAIIPGVNTLFNGLLNTPGFRNLDFSHFKFGLGGGMAVQRPVAEQWQHVTGTVLLEGYGLTECSPVVTVNPPHLKAYKGAIGLPVPSTDMMLVDENGQEVEPGQPGELWVKGPQVMAGYYNRAEATDEIMQNGWLATGDIARVDDEGYFYIVDRKKDMILVSGFNVFPNEIEEVAVMHDAILEAAAVGVSHQMSGQVVKLFIVRKDPTLTTDAVIAHCRAHLTGYKVPKHVEFRDELPKTNVGKILRRELRD